MIAEAWSDRRSGRLRHQDDARSDDEIDYARVVHSGSFRRLQGKTQILSLGDDDFYRTRLTHSLEVAQVGEGILQHLRARSAGTVDFLPSSAQIRALGLAHDIGHPPFGHGGEVALNYCMRADGGFEGNAQTLRLLARLEAYSASHGADLTRRTLLGLLKYPVLQSQAINPDLYPALADGPTTFAILDSGKSKPAKACYDCDKEVFDWILQPLNRADRERLTAVKFEPGKHGKTSHKSLDCSIMDEADNIAYGVHDLEDAVALEMVTPDDWREAVPRELCGELVRSLSDRPLDGVDASYDGLVASLFGGAGARKRLIGRLVHHFIAATSIETVDGFDEPLLANRLGMRPAAEKLLAALRDLISSVVIQGPRVQHLDFKGQKMVVASFEALMSSPQRLLPTETFKLFERADRDPRIVSDYLACLTDAALLRLYDRLFSPRMGTIFDRI